MAGMKFSMEADALTQHTDQGLENNENLGALVKQLVAATEPISKTFNGPAKAAFNTLKQNADVVADTLKQTHTALMNSATAQNRAFITASNEAVDAHASTTSAIDFDAAIAKN